MIAQESFAVFDEVIARLPRLAPPDALRSRTMTIAKDDGFLSAQAIPEDPTNLSIVAVIDHGIPFAHRLLTTSGGHSRVAAIWLQDAPARDKRVDIAFGRELRGTMIDSLRFAGGSVPVRDEDAIYRKLGLMDPARAGGSDLARRTSHGAGVTAMAAGYDPDDPAGLNHPLIAVSLPDFSVGDTSGSFAPLFIQAAVVYVISRARALTTSMIAATGRQIIPSVTVNLSMGLTAGARDGSSLISRLQDAISTAPRTGLGSVHFVLPTGNNRQKQARAVLRPGEEIDWHLPPDDRTPSALELWGPAQTVSTLPIQLRITLPNGNAIETKFAIEGGVARIMDDHGRELTRLALQHRQAEGGKRQCLTIILPPTLPETSNEVSAPPGLWRIALLPSAPGPCELAVHRDDSLPGFRQNGRQSRLVDPSYRRREDDGHWSGADSEPPFSKIRRNGTSSSYAGGRAQLRIGGTLARPSSPPAVAPYCGLLAAGAPGDITAYSDRSWISRGIIVPGIRGAAMQAMSGTSIAAPRVARWLSGQLAAGAVLHDRASILAALRGTVTTVVPDLNDSLRVPWHDGI